MPHVSASPTRNPEGGAAVRARPRLRLVEGEPGRPVLLQGDESRSVHRAPLPYLLKSLLSLLLIGWHIVRGFPVISSGVRAANPVISSPFRAGNPDESSGVASAPGGSLSRTMRYRLVACPRAGACLMRGYGFAGDGVPELAVSVLPGHRGRGVGAAMLSSLIERCSELGHPALSLSVQRSNPAARLYERLGFQEVSGDDGEAVMVLPLGGRDEGARGGASLERARAAALRVLTAPGLAGRAYLQGGLAP